MKGSKKPEIDEVGDLRAKDCGGRKRLSAPLKSMESLNRKEIDCRLEDFCMNKRMRGISETNSSGSESSNQRMIGKSDGELEENDNGNGDRGRSLFKCDSFGWISVIGRRRAMEDAVAEFDSYRFFAVYDGHGGSGVTNACRDRLHQLLEEEVDGRAKGSGGGAAVEWEKVMRERFRKMDEEIGGGRAFDVQDEDGDGGGGSGSGRELALNTVGSTALVVIVGKAVVVVANCGDSRVLLCRDGGTVPLSRDHKPDQPDERERVEAAGGRIINWNGCRVLGVLSTSRSIGDHYLKPYVISEPEVTVWKRSDSDQFLIVASDGLWDVVSNEFACEVVRCFDGQIRRRFPKGWVEVLPQRQRLCWPNWQWLGEAKTISVS